MKADDLLKAGLTQTEARIYLDLLGHGQSGATDIAKRLRIDRTVAYHTLRNLQKKGLVSYLIKNYKRTYEAADPENLLGPIKEQEAYTQQLIPHLRKLERAKQSAQEVLTYEGKEGLRVLLNDILKAQSFASYGASGKSYDILKYEMPHLAARLEKKKIPARIVTHSDSRDHPMTRVKGTRFRYLDAVETQATTTIYADKVGIVIYADSPLVIIIRSAHIARSYTSYFNALWKIAKR